MADAQMTIGNYRTNSLLGIGSFGRVYQAQHLFLKRTVALKLMQATPLNTESEREQFLQEAQFLEVLRHRYILPVLDGGIHEGVPYIVSEYASHGSLRARLQKQESHMLPTGAVLTMLSQIGQALHHVHLAGIIHRDLKPENILFNAKNEALLADFGLATVIASATMKSVSNSGTPRYMAPEQFRGHVSYASDQYALGCIAYELFTGRPPFQAPDPIALMFMHVSDAPIRPKILNPALPDYIDQAIMQALAKQPEARHADIRAFMAALHVPDGEDIYPTEILLTTKNALVEDVPQQGGIALGIDSAPVQRAGPQQLSTSSHVTPLNIPFVEMTGRPSAPPLPFREAISTQAQDAPTFLMQRQPMIKPISIVEPIHQQKGSLMLRGIAGLLISLAVILVVGSVAFFLSLSKNPSLATVSPTATPTAVTPNGAMDGFDPQHTRFNPYEHILSPTNVSKLVPALKFATGGHIGSAATVANNIVYINANGNANDGYMYALDVNTGVKLWQAHIGSYDFGCAPTVANGVVYMGSFDYHLYAFDAKTGTILWKAPTTGRIGSSPTLVNGVIYIGSDDGILYAFKASDGTKIWSVPTGGVISSSPAIANGLVYVGSDDHNLYAINATDGTIRWTVTTGDQVISSPTIANGIVYVGSMDHTFYAVNAKTGAPLWQKQTGGGIRSSPAIANGIVYIGSEDNTLYALGAAKGTLLWTASTGSAIDSSPTVANGVVYVGSNDHNLYAFKASGCGSVSCSHLWTFTTGDQVVSSPTVANGVVYVGSNDGNLYTFHLAGGTS